MVKREAHTHTGLDRSLHGSPAGALHARVKSALPARVVVQRLTSVLLKHLQQQCPQTRAAHSPACAHPLDHQHSVRQQCRPPVAQTGLRENAVAAGGSQHGEILEGCTEGEEWWLGIFQSASTATRILCDSSHFETTPIRCHQFVCWWQVCGTRQREGAEGTACCDSFLVLLTGVARDLRLECDLMTLCAT